MYILLVFKHIKEGNFFKLNFSKVVIFADENVPQEMLVYLFDVTLYYIQVA